MADFTSSGASGSGTNATANEGASAVPTEELVVAISDLSVQNQAIAELAKRKDQFPNFGPLLLRTRNAIAALIQAIIAVYPFLSPPTLSGEQSTQICNTLALLQCVAAHPETRGAFLSAHVPQYVFPLLDTTERSRPFEYIRITSLGVIAALVKGDNPVEIVQYLLNSEVIRHCLKSMDVGCDISKTVATFIIRKILLSEEGLNHVCSIPERFFPVARMLSRMVEELLQKPEPRLLKDVISCYLCLSKEPRACDVLKHELPAALKDGTFAQYLTNDAVMRGLLQQLLRNLQQRQLFHQRLEAAHPEAAGYMNIQP